MRVAIIILNYNMPEATDAMVEHINLRVKTPHDLIVYDNGSDIIGPSPHTTHFANDNKQTTGGWIDAIDQVHPDTGAVWLLITSCKFPLTATYDQLLPLVRFMEANPNAVGVHPALTEESTTNWRHLKNRGHYQPREVWMIDNIAPLWRLDWLKDNMFDSDLKYAWGIDLETCYQARKEGRTLWVHEQSEITKITDIGYKMDRMNMTAKTRSHIASRNMEKILSEKYGPDWWKIMTKDHVEEYML